MAGLGTVGRPLWKITVRICCRIDEIKIFCEIEKVDNNFVDWSNLSNSNSDNREK